MAENAPQKEHEPVLSDAEVVIVGVLFLILDIIDWFEVGIPATDLVSWIGQFGLYKKGVSGTYQAAVGILELIPGIDYLPIRTASLLIATYADRHPDSKLSKLIKVAEVAQAAKVAFKARKELAERQRDVKATIDDYEKGEAGAGQVVAAQYERQEAKKVYRGARKDLFNTVNGTGPEAATEGEGEEQEAPAASEDQELEDVMSGDPLGRHIMRAMSAEEILAQIGNNDNEEQEATRFNPDEMGPEMEPKKGPEWARRRSQGAKGIMNGKEVDLRDSEKRAA